MRDARHKQTTGEETSMTALLLTLLLAPAAPPSGLNGSGLNESEPRLNETRFARLHQQLQPPAEEGWSSIPWKTSLVQACVEAARQKKPVFMVCRAGHPLGCV
jgi:hypothetical protein